MNCLLCNKPMDVLDAELARKGLGCTQCQLNARINHRAVTPAAAELRRMRDTVAAGQLELHVERANGFICDDEDEVK